MVHDLAGGNTAAGSKTSTQKAAKTQMSYHGCFSGDCPHLKETECVRAVEKHCTEQEERVAELEAAIDNHRYKTGHHMCWENDQDLWAILSDKVKLDHTRPPRAEFLKRCEEYCDSREPPKPKPLRTDGLDYKCNHCPQRFRTATGKWRHIEESHGLVTK